MRCRALSLEEKAKLFSEASLPLREQVLFRIAAGSELTADEIVALNVDDVAADGGEVKQSTVVVASDERRARKVKHELVLPPQVQPLVAKLVAQRRAICVGPLDVIGVPLFESRFGGRLSASQARRCFREWRDRVGLPDDLRFESLRESYRETVAGLIREGLCRGG